jgi:hypothetical protein
MKKIDLNERAGYLFAPFEKELIFNHEHMGWVHYTGWHRFILKKTPFSNHSSIYEYFTPSDICPSENEFVEVEVDNLVKKNPKLIGKTCYVEYGDQYYEVVGCERASLEKLLGRPYLKRKEFLNRISDHWKNAEEDHLDLALALQILSCPESIYGKGGIGTATFNFHSARVKPLKDLRSTINFLLPQNFRKTNPFYEYDFIQKYSDERKVKKRRDSNNCSELSYNYLDFIPQVNRIIPVQIPTVIQNAEYRKGIQFFDPDVLEYLLTAVMIRPSVEENMINGLRSGIIEVRERINPDRADRLVVFDNYTFVKLANAFCRLFLEQNLTDNMFSESRRAFLEIYHEYHDLAELQLSHGEDQSWINPSARVSYAHPGFDLDANDLRVYRVIIKINREQGLEWVPFDEIRQRADLNDTELHESLQRLVDAAKIISRMNYTEFKPLFFDAEE